MHATPPSPRGGSGGGERVLRLCTLALDLGPSPNASVSVINQTSLSCELGSTPGPGTALSQSLGSRVLGSGSTVHGPRSSLRVWEAGTNWCVRGSSCVALIVMMIRGILIRSACVCTFACEMCRVVWEPEQV
eukprot:3219420-Rhodomonas_salina.1